MGLIILVLFFFFTCTAVCVTNPIPASHFHLVFMNKTTVLNGGIPSFRGDHRTWAQKNQTNAALLFYSAEYFSHLHRYSYSRRTCTCSRHASVTHYKVTLHLDL